MINNSQDKGYIMVRLKQIENDWHLCEIGFTQNPGEDSFYVDYENGTIYLDTGDSTKQIIGYYEQTACGPDLAKVYERTRSRVIGRVGEELIYFRAREADYSAGRYMPDEECLAWYTKAGGITPAGQVLTHVGLINGSEIGGAAAFVALFFSYNFKSIFCDYFDMDDASFKQKYASFL